MCEHCDYLWSEPTIGLMRMHPELQQMERNIRRQMDRMWNLDRGWSEHNFSRSLAYNPFEFKLNVMVHEEVLEVMNSPVFLESDRPTVAKIANALVFMCKEK